MGLGVATAGCVDGGVVGQRGVVITRAVPQFVGAAPMKVPPMIGVPLVLLLMTPPGGWESFSTSSVRFVSRRYI